MDFPSEQDLRDWQKIKYILHRISIIEKGNFIGLKNMFISISQILKESKYEMKNILQLEKLFENESNFFQIIKKIANFALMLPYSIKP